MLRPHRLCRKAIASRPGDSSEKYFLQHSFLSSWRSCSSLGIAMQATHAQARVPGAHT